MNKNESRLRRARKTRAKIREIGLTRLSIYRTPRHIYAQLLSFPEPLQSKTLACVSTVQKSLREKLKNTGNIEAAKEVGKLIAIKAKELGLKSVAFDRSGYKYHGRVKALAESARENGLTFAAPWADLIG